MENSDTQAPNEGSNEQMDTKSPKLSDDQEIKSPSGSQNSENGENAKGQTANELRIHLVGSQKKFKRMHPKQQLKLQQMAKEQDEEIKDQVYFWASGDKQESDATPLATSMTPKSSKSETSNKLFIKINGQFMQTKGLNQSHDQYAEPSVNNSAGQQPTKNEYEYNYEPRLLDAPQSKSLEKLNVESPKSIKDNVYNMNQVKKELQHIQKESEQKTRYIHTELVDKNPSYESNIAGSGFNAYAEGKSDLLQVRSSEGRVPTSKRADVASTISKSTSQRQKLQSIYNQLVGKQKESLINYAAQTIQEKFENLMIIRRLQQAVEDQQVLSAVEARTNEQAQWKGAIKEEDEKILEEEEVESPRNKEEAKKEQNKEQLKANSNQKLPDDHGRPCCDNPWGRKKLIMFDKIEKSKQAQREEGRMSFLTEYKHDCAKANLRKVFDNNHIGVHQKRTHLENMFKQRLADCVKAQQKKRITFNLHVLYTAKKRKKLLAIQKERQNLAQMGKEDFIEEVNKMAHQKQGLSIRDQKLGEYAAQQEGKRKNADVGLKHTHGLAFDRGQRHATAVESTQSRRSRFILDAMKNQLLRKIKRETVRLGDGDLPVGLAGSSSESGYGDSDAASSGPSSSPSQPSDYTESFHSDDSYYDEVEQLELCDLNKEQVADSKFNHMFLKQGAGECCEFEKQFVKQESLKIDKVFEIAQQINKKPLYDRGLKYLMDFLSEIPVFQDKLQSLVPGQYRTCLEKMKIRCCERSTILFKQGDNLRYAFVVLLGQVNKYEGLLPLTRFKWLHEPYQTVQSASAGAVKKAHGACGRSIPSGSPDLEKEEKTFVTKSNQGTESSNQVRQTEPNQQINTEISDGKDEQSDLNLKKIDDTIDKLLKIDGSKIGHFERGELFGTKLESLDAYTKKMAYTCVCKTDCILLELEHDLFDILQRQQIRKQKEFLISHLLRTFPKLTNHYTEYRISEHAGQIIRTRNFRKNLILQMEGVGKKPSDDVIYMIIEGKVDIYKIIQYIDQNGKLIKKEELIMQIQDGDILGEDTVFYERKPSYTAKAKTELKTFIISSRDFKHYYGKGIASHRRILNIRRAFLEARLKELQRQNTKRCLEFNTKISAHLKKDWDLHSSQYFNDNPNNPVVEKNKTIYLREEQLINKTRQEQAKVENEYIKQYEETEENLPSPQKRKQFQVYSTRDQRSSHPYQNENTYSSSSLKSSLERIHNLGGYTNRAPLLKGEHTRSNSQNVDENSHLKGADSSTITLLNSNAPHDQNNLLQSITQRRPTTQSQLSKRQQSIKAFQRLHMDRRSGQASLFKARNSVHQIEIQKQNQLNQIKLMQNNFNQRSMIDMRYQKQRKEEWKQLQHSQGFSSTFSTPMKVDEVQEPKVAYTQQQNMIYINISSNNTNINQCSQAAIAIKGEASEDNHLGLERENQDEELKSLENSLPKGNEVINKAAAGGLQLPTERTVRIGKTCGQNNASPPVSHISKNMSQEFQSQAKENTRMLPKSRDCSEEKQQRVVSTFQLCNQDLLHQDQKDEENFDKVNTQTLNLANMKIETNQPDKTQRNTAQQRLLIANNKQNKQKDRSPPAQQNKLHVQNIIKEQQKQETVNMPQILDIRFTQPMTVNTIYLEKQEGSKGSIPSKLTSECQVSFRTGGQTALLGADISPECPSQGLENANLAELNESVKRKKGRSKVDDVDVKPFIKPVIIENHIQNVNQVTKGLNVQSLGQQKGADNGVIKSHHQSVSSTLDNLMTSVSYNNKFISNLKKNAKENQKQQIKQVHNMNFSSRIIKSQSNFFNSKLTSGQMKQFGEYDISKQYEIDDDTKRFVKKYQSLGINSFAKQNSAYKRLSKMKQFRPDYIDDQKLIIKEVYPKNNNYQSHRVLSINAKGNKNDIKQMKEENVLYAGAKLISEPTQIEEELQNNQQEDSNIHVVFRNKKGQFNQIQSQKSEILKQIYYDHAIKQEEVSENITNQLASANICESVSKLVTDQDDQDAQTTMQKAERNTLSSSQFVRTQQQRQKSQQNQQRPHIGMIFSSTKVKINEKQISRRGSINTQSMRNLHSLINNNQGNEERSEYKNIEGEQNYSTKQNNQYDQQSINSNRIGQVENMWKQQLEQQKPVSSAGFTTNVKTSMSFIYKNNPKGSYYNSLIESKSHENKTISKFKKNKQMSMCISQQYFNQNLPEIKDGSKISTPSFNPDDENSSQPDRASKLSSVASKSKVAQDIKSKNKTERNTSTSIQLQIYGNKMDNKETKNSTLHSFDQSKFNQYSTQPRQLKTVTGKRSSEPFNKHKNKSKASLLNNDLQMTLQEMNVQQKETSQQNLPVKQPLQLVQKRLNPKDLKQFSNLNVSEAQESGGGIIQVDNPKIVNNQESFQILQKEDLRLNDDAKYDIFFINTNPSTLFGDKPPVQMVNTMPLNSEDAFIHFRQPIQDEGAGVMGTEQGTPKIVPANENQKKSVSTGI